MNTTSCSRFHIGHCVVLARARARRYAVSSSVAAGGLLVGLALLLLGGTWAISVSAGWTAAAAMFLVAVWRAVLPFSPEPDEEWSADRG